VKASGWTSSPKPHRTGYPSGYPLKMYRSDFILGLLYHQFEIFQFRHNAMRDIINRRVILKHFSKIYIVSFFLKNFFLKKTLMTSTLVFPKNVLCKKTLQKKKSFHQ
jgi:hypothetical protein